MLCVDDSIAVRGADAGGCGIRAAYGCRKDDNSLRKGGAGGAV